MLMVIVQVVITSMDVLGASEGGATLADCPPGSYTDMEGSTDCKLCSPGTYANSTAGAQEVRHLFSRTLESKINVNFLH